jgi:hypothetical protein
MIMREMMKVYKMRILKAVFLAVIMEIMKRS